MAGRYAVKSAAPPQGIGVSILARLNGRALPPHLRRGDNLGQVSILARLNGRALPARPGMAAA